VKPSVTRALPNHLAGVTCLLIFAAGLIRLEAAKVAPAPNDAPKPEIIGEGAISTPEFISTLPFLLTTYTSCANRIW
jgi:hypothetical protein